MLLLLLYAAGVSRSTDICVPLTHFIQVFDEEVSLAARKHVYKSRRPGWSLKADFMTHNKAYDVGGGANVHIRDISNSIAMETSPGDNKDTVKNSKERPQNGSGL